MTDRKKVLIVDDSGLARRMVRSIIEEMPEAPEISEAVDGTDGIRKAIEYRPDVITLDLEMPGHDGLQVIKSVMRAAPANIIMISTRTTRGAEITMECLAAGAFDFVAKPTSNDSKDLFGFRVRRALTGALNAAPKPPSSRTTSKVIAGGGIPKIVVVASSTGGPPALERFFGGISGLLPFPIVVVQHMPAEFTGPLAARLNDKGSLSIAEAKDRSPLIAGEVIIARGGYHLAVRAKEVRFDDSPPVTRLKPWSDVTFRSAAATFGAGSLGIVFTGMGKDGLEGSRAIKEAGGRVWAQDPASVVVDGMPRAVRDSGLADFVGSPEDFAGAISQWARVGAKA